LEALVKMTWKHDISELEKLEVENIRQEAESAMGMERMEKGTHDVRLPPERIATHLVSVGDGIHLQA